MRVALPGQDKFLLFQPQLVVQLFFNKFEIFMSALGKKEGDPKIGGVLRQRIESPSMLNLTNELGIYPFRREIARFLHANKLT